MDCVNNIEKLSWLRAAAASGHAEEIRISARLTKAEVASAVGVDHTTVGRWERGERRPKGDAALRYAVLLQRLARAQVAA